MTSEPQWALNILSRKRILNTRYTETFSVGKEGAFDGKNEQEEDSDKLPATVADVLAGSAKHNAQVAKQKHDHKQMYGNPPDIGLERDKRITWVINDAILHFFCDIQNKNNTFTMFYIKQLHFFCDYS